MSYMVVQMDKASIVRDAIAYIEQLQEEERRVLAEISALESSGTVTAAAVKFKAQDAAGSYPWPRKRTRTAPGGSSIDAAPPLQILEVTS